MLPAGLGLLLLVYWALSFRPSSLAYLDYVDGYYIYVAHRMAHGAVLYRQVMGVQPPLLYLVGDALFRLHDSLVMTRIYAAVLHSLAVLLVSRCAFQLYGHRPTVLIAALLYSVAPFGLAWSGLFDPNPLVTLLTVASVSQALGGSTRSAALAGLFGALALATKVFYLPVGLALTLFFWHRRRDLCAPYLLALLGGVALTALLGSLSAGAAFWQGLLVQQASGTSVASLVVGVYEVLTHEWPLLILALAALPLLRRLDTPGAALLLWYLAASIIILGATVKMGTFAPIFQFAEPALALAAAPLLGGLAAGASWSAPPQRSASRGVALLVPAVGLLLLWAWPTLSSLAPGSDRSVRAVVSALHAAGTTDRVGLGPPFYLYLAGWRQFGERADVNLWGQQSRRGDAQAVAWHALALGALRRGAIPLVLVDFRVRALSGVDAALLLRYRRLPFADPLPHDRAVELWVPR